MRNARFLAIGLLALTLGACSGSQGNVSGGSSSQQSSYTSVEDLERQATDGDRTAQFTLGALYQEGEGVTKDLAKAREWFEKAAEQDEPRSQFNLGVMYYNGEGVTQDLAKAFEYFSEAAGHGNPRATFNIGVMYYRGESVEADLEEAKELFEKAAYLGIAESQFNLAVMYAKGETVTADPVEAFAWFTVADKSGDDKASGILEQARTKLSAEQLQEANDRANEIIEEIRQQSR
jgi:uncharacterized protein